MRREKPQCCSSLQVVPLWLISVSVRVDWLDCLRNIILLTSSSMKAVCHCHWSSPKWNVSFPVHFIVKCSSLAAVRFMAVSVPLGREEMTEDGKSVGAKCWWQNSCKYDEYEGSFSADNDKRNCHTELVHTLHRPCHNCGVLSEKLK